MKTKIFTLLFAIVASIGIMTAETHTGSCGDNLTWTVDTETGVLTIFGTGKMNDYRVINQWSSDTPWYSYINIDSIKIVIIEDGVTCIGSAAFYNCSSLTSVTIPNSVTSIGNSAFKGSIRLTSITIPNSVTSIGKDAFYNCPSLTSITIPNSVTSVGFSAFEGCTSLTSVTIGNGVTSIGNLAFKGCSSLTSVTIGNGVTSIGAAFGGCSSLLSITIPNSVTSIGDGAFSGCSGLTSVTIPNSVTSIGAWAFYYCSGLTSIVVENENSVYDSRNNCNAIIETATNMLIAGCQNTIIPNSVTSIGEAAFYGCSGPTSITIPNSVTSIGDYAFSYCRSLLSITIPNSVTSIGDYAFRDIPNIVYNGTATGSPWGAKNVNGYVEGYLLYSDASKTKLLKCSTAVIGEIVIPNSVTSIGSEAFRDCSSLTSVTIPNNVTSIGENAFRDCSSLTSVTIPNSVTSIGKNAFNGCSNLEKVTLNSNTIATDYKWLPNLFGYNIKEFVIGSDVKNIHAGAFYNLINLTSITVDDTNPAYCDIDGILFTKDKTSLIVYPIGRTDTRYSIPNSVTSIGSSAFRDCSNITSLIIPNSVTSIGNYAFYGCSNITSLIIPNSVTSIGGSAFSYCRSLTSVTIPNSVTSIGNYAFSGCSGLTSVTIGNSITSIGAWAFWGCSGLTSVTLGTSVKVIEEHAFDGCTAIETITCYSMRPPTVNTDALYGLDYSTIVYVPADYFETYNMHDVWGLYDVRPLGAKTIETADIKVTPTDKTAEVAWPQVSGAATYELVIKDKNGNIICTLTFNAKGQLTQIAFNAPSRNNTPQHTQAAGFSFTVTGLEESTEYIYTLTTKDSKGNVIDTQTGSFKTGGGTAVEETERDSATGVRKVMRDGVIYLLMPNGRMYDLQGAEVR